MPKPETVTEYTGLCALSISTMERLQGSPNLVTLNLIVWFGCEHWVQKINSVVRSCKNLQALGLYGYDDHESSSQSLNFRLSDLQIPNVTRLSLKGFTLFPEDTLALTDGHGCVDWSKLQALSLSDLPLLLSLEGQLHSLQVLHLSTPIPILRGSPARNHDVSDQDLIALRSILYKCVNIKELHLIGYTACFSKDVFLHLNKTLQNLKLHEPGDPKLVTLRRVLSLDEIEELGTACQNLKTLALDVTRENVSRTKFEGQ